MLEARLTKAELRQVIDKIVALDDNRVPTPSCMPPDYWTTIRQLTAESRLALVDLLENNLQKILALEAAKRPT
jgi:hypothetical protein